MLRRRYFIAWGGMVRRFPLVVVFVCLALGCTSNSGSTSGAPSSTSRAQSSPTTTIPRAAGGGQNLTGTIQSDWQIAERDVQLQAGDGIRVAVTSDAGEQDPELDLALAVDPSVVVDSSIGGDDGPDNGPPDYFFEGRPGYETATTPEAYVDPQYGLVLADAYTGQAAYNNQHGFWLGGRPTDPNEAWLGAVAPFTGTYHLLLRGPTGAHYNVRYDLRRGSTAKAEAFDPNQPQALDRSALAAAVFADKDWLQDNGFYRFPIASRNANPPRTGPDDFTIGPEGIAKPLH